MLSASLGVEANAEALSKAKEDVTWSAHRSSRKYLVSRQAVHQGEKLRIVGVVDADIIHGRCVGVWRVAHVDRYGRCVDLCAVMPVCLVECD